MNEKICLCCREVKPLEAFSKRKRSKDGLQSWCKECTAIRAEAWRKNNPERASANYRRWEIENRQRIRETRRAWIKRNPDYMRNYLKSWHQKNPGRLAKTLKAYEARYPEKTTARRILNAALRKGEIRKPTNCECCNQQTESRELQGHHPNYNQPLVVEWLCRQCHAALHRALRDHEAKYP